MKSSSQEDFSDLLQFTQNEPFRKIHNSEMKETIISKRYYLLLLLLKDTGKKVFWQSSLHLFKDLSFLHVLGADYPI